MHPRPRPLEHDSDGNRFTGILTVVEVVSIVVANINVVRGIPVLRPVPRPRVHHHERKAAVLEARVPPDDDWFALDAEPISVAEMETEAVLRDVVAPIAPPLRPGAVIGLPVRRAILLPGSVLLPSAILPPTALLLPSLCLLTRTLRRGIASLLATAAALLGVLLLDGWLVLRGMWRLSPLLLLPLLRLRLLLGLLGALWLGLPMLWLSFLLGLLGTLWLRLPLLRPRLLLGLLGTLGLWLLRLGPRLLLGLLGVLLLLLFGLALFLMLSVSTGARSKQQEQRGGADNCIEFH